MSPDQINTLEQITREFMEFYPPAVDMTRRDTSLVLGEAIEGLESTSSPGALWPGGSNKILLEMRFHEIVSTVALLYVFLRDNDITSWSSERIFWETGIAYKIFIKDELHPLDKADSNRWRLIFSNPIVLNILERMVFGPTLDVEKLKGVYMEIPTSIGLVMSGPEKADECFRLIDKAERFLGNRIASTDGSGWDWSVANWHYMLAKQRYQNTSPEFQRLTTNLLHIAMNKTVQFSDGLLLCQLTPGIVPSGSYQTGSLNSFLRALLRFSIDKTLSITMGDDCLEQYTESLVSDYKNLGYTIKFDGNVSSLNNFEFCSKYFRNGGVIPVKKSVEKMILSLYLTKDPQVVYSLVSELGEAEDYVDLASFVLAGKA